MVLIPFRAMIGLVAAQGEKNYGYYQRNRFCVHDEGCDVKIMRKGMFAGRDIYEEEEKKNSQDCQAQP